MNRILSVTRARSLYLRRLAESRRPGSPAEQSQAQKEVKQAERALQQAQLTQRLRSGRAARTPRPTDWNGEAG